MLLTVVERFLSFLTAYSSRITYSGLENYAALRPVAINLHAATFQASACHPGLSKSFSLEVAFGGIGRTSG